jgi:hypothetical protein
MQVHTRLHGIICATICESLGDAAMFYFRCSEGVLFDN